MKTPPIEYDFYVGQTIKLWDASEVTKKMMWLASKGVTADDIGNNTLKVVKIDEDNN